MRMVAPVYTFDPKILPEGIAKLRWEGRGAEILCIFRGQIRSSEVATRGKGARSAPFGGGNELKKTGARSARARTRGQNPLVYHIFI